MTRTYHWRGLDDLSRIDHAGVAFTHDSMSAYGTSFTSAYATAWQLSVGAGWVTEDLAVTVRGVGWWRRLDLVRGGDGSWTAEVEGAGDVDLPAPGLADPDSVAGAIDCDLGLCPVTNTMPIRRLGLLERDVAPTTLVMAWVEVPSLRVIRDDQIYASSSGIVRYESFDGDFQADLGVDVDGVVIDYPALAERITPTG